jgi:6-phosphofructokinase 1
MRFGVLTSGGDAPGMNAAIAGVCDHASRHGVEVVGFAHGYRGLSEGAAVAITPNEARQHLGEAGTWLGSSRYPPLHSHDGVGRVRTALAAAGADGLVVIGGDGSLAGARTLVAAGARIAFIPATIDNDVGGTETTIGHDSAVQYAVAVIDQLRITGRALPGRAFVVQTLGGGTDLLARAVAAAAGIDDVLPSIDPAELERVAARVGSLAQHGEAIVVMPEGTGNAVDVAATLQHHAGVRVHPTILGHAQRAAPLTDRDIALALDAGRAAAHVLLQQRGGFIALNGGQAQAMALSTTTAADIPPPPRKE